MNEIMTQSFTDMSHLTPIEIALGVDGNGMTTAKRLYEFLELNPSIYSAPAGWIREYPAQEGMQQPQEQPKHRSVLSTSYPLLKATGI